MFRELERSRAIFDLPERKFVLDGAGRDLTVRFHGKVASTPFGPAAGPQSQLAQNLVLSFLVGARILELKTVQVNDRLKIPRPCIDMRNVGYNVEWSQELRLQESLVEYVKGSMLIEMLVASGKLPIAPAFARTIFDMSVGYDLAGIQSEAVQAFIRGMKDARAIVDRRRREIPDEYKAFRDLDYTTALSNTLTLSTFHGCPPDEIERIVDWLLREHQLNVIVKLNPTLLGPDEARDVLNGTLGYADRIPDDAFSKDTTWPQAVDFTGRLGDTARALGLGFGVKFTNTLIVENRGDFLPGSEKTSYLSGAPLHVLAMRLVARFRETFEDRYPVSFSAGVDKHNFADAVALGLVPVTVCSDLLKTGGYGRAQAYFDDLGARMGKVGARTIDEWVMRRGSQRKDAEAPRGESSSAALRLSAFALNPVADTVSAAKLRNTGVYVEAIMRDRRYASAANMKTPPKLGTRLELFNCVTCDKCVPVCPNDANFTFVLPEIEIPVVKVCADGKGGWTETRAAPLKFTKKHQIGNFADFCNECGNCDVFCPEDGGPYILKPRFFGSEALWRAFPTLDGFFVERAPYGDRVLGRFGGTPFSLCVVGTRATFSGDSFEFEFDANQVVRIVTGRASGEVDLTYFHIMHWLGRAILDGDDVNYVNIS